jgi:hypothetical protein
MHVVPNPAKSGIQEQKTTITSATGQLYFAFYFPIPRLTYR